jgi:hypothetical protein
MEPIAGGDGEAREGLFVAVLCASHEIGIHASSDRAGVELGPAHSHGMGGLSVQLTHSFVAAAQRLED